MPAYNSIHRQQLFHWIGAHIDARATKGKLTDPLREEYVACLRTALARGLWVKTPRVPDFLGRGDLIKVRRPIACFTEWTLGQSLPHTTRYGRLALGFPKKYVLARGGQPVTYVRDSQRHDPYSRALKAIARALAFDPHLALLPPRKLAELREHFDYLAHFAKKIKKTRQPPRSPGVLKRKRKIPAKPAPQTTDGFERRFGRTLHFLEEREWRIVYDHALTGHFQPGPGGPRQPEYTLPFEAGNDLFTVVLPDNRTLNAAMADAQIRRKLFPASAPHVTLLSLQDIGTF